MAPLNDAEANEEASSAPGTLTPSPKTSPEKVAAVVEIAPP